ncbi:putative transcriptional regulator, PucR family [Segniliparus rotundus DSM 44985]|uniref:Putative transcriptional regulator, PucR family n=1 Tax=Segniliparus rotundus (strain ATCC BAA-972 / CDC 1076 / CIP 108378 / DSM 44985 / JCM 13578) TaxID=640132 RepID=D6ZCY2_SEGRD|nr:putative transcriptional regulator, PucR family [Segniliparus rotundus DSM 44985]
MSPAARGGPRPRRSKKRNREPLPENLLRRIKHFSGHLATDAVRSMDVQLPYFAELDTNQRANVQLVVQTAVVNFVEWLQNPSTQVGLALQPFEVVPQDLARHITLSQTVDMIRVSLEHFELYLPALAKDEAQLVNLTESVLRYGREIGFAAAAAYAEAAEARGSWDNRLEAVLVDAVIRGDASGELQSRAATLNWDANAPATVIVGEARTDSPTSIPVLIHNIAQRHSGAALSAVHGRKLITVVSGALPSNQAFLAELLKVFEDSPVVIGPTAPSLAEARISATDALSALEAVAGWRGAPRPAHADELLPERVLNGDISAARALTEQVVSPLLAAGASLLTTLESYLDTGGGVDACARELFVHPNTVRYRLRRIAAVTGLDPTDPRDGFVLRVASIIGRISASPGPRDVGFTSTWAVEHSDSLGSSEQRASADSSSNSTSDL